MIVELVDCLKSASGTLCKGKDCRVIVTTRRASSNNPHKVRMYLRPNECYERKSPPSEKELQARDLFRRRSVKVKELLKNGTYEDRNEAWEAVKKMIVE